MGRAFLRLSEEKEPYEIPSEIFFFFFFSVGKEKCLKFSGKNKNKNKKKNKSLPDCFDLQSCLFTVRSQALVTGIEFPLAAACAPEQLLTS